MNSLPSGRDNILVLFSWIIANKFTRVYCVLTKLGTKMCPYTTFLCSKFQFNQITLIVTFTPWRKEENKQEQKKWKKLSQFLKVYISETNAWTILLECGVLMVEGIFSAKRSSTKHKSSTKLDIHKNCIIVLPVNIVIMWYAGFLGHTTHYCVSW